MQNFHRQALQGVENLWRIYLLSHHPEGLEQVLPPFSEDAVLLGISLENQVVGLDAVKERFQRDEQNAQDLNTKLFKECYVVQSISPDVCVVYGAFWLRIPQEAGEKLLQICLSVVCSSTANGILLRHLHRSIPHPAVQTAPARDAPPLSGGVYSADHEQYRLAIEASDDIIIEMNLEQKTISVDQEKLHRIYHICLTDLPPQKVFSAIRSLIHPEDITQFTTIFGVGAFPVWQQEHEVKAMILRLRNPQKGYVWVCNSLIPVRNHNGKVIKVLNHVKNIDLQKRKELQMLGIAQTDSLTSVYNRGSTECAINDFLSSTPDAAGVMLMIDVDNFKKINDTYGHLRGDKVLVKLSRILRSVCREDDIVGRVGGDEFLVFVKQVYSRKLISAKAQDIIEQMDAFLLADGIFCDASCSIGIATAPLYGTTYSMLFCQADAALYQAKRQAKHTFHFAAPM